MFESAKSKLGRAQHHFANLVETFGRFKAEKPYRFVVDQNDEGGKPCIKVVFDKPIPDAIPLIIPRM